ncbi:MAG: EFR1 family ferrodoxin [Rikenellaceae bacterium]
MTILYFTATGNSLYIAKSFGGETISIPAMVKAGTLEFADDKIGIIFPIYSNKVMPYIEEFLKKAKFNCDYLFGVMTYGIYAAGAVNHLQEIGTKAGHNFAYINTIRMVDSWIPGFKMEGQIKGEHKKEIKKHLEVIAGDVKASKKMIRKSSGFSRLLTRYQVKSATKPNPKGGIFGLATGLGIKNFIKVEETCISCGVCASVCPMNNITVDKVAKTIELGDTCLSCFACTHNCPTNSIRLTKERSRARYRNSHISLAEIVKANNS